MHCCQPHPSLNTYIQVEGGEVPDVWVVESSQEISRYTVGNLAMVMTMNMLMTMTRQPGIGPN